jgi:hypothetical protein
MEIRVDLFGCKDSKDVLLRFGEILQFGGPKGNVPARANINNIGWGINWNAFNDSLRDLEVGGIWGSAKKVEFPLKLIISNYQDFSKSEPKEFKILKEILEEHQKEYVKEGKKLQVVFS